MDSKAVKILLEKYWEGTSSLAEESQLRTYFNQAEVPEEFKAEQPLFQFFKSEKEVTLSDGFMDRMMSQLPEEETEVTNKQPEAKVRRMGFYLTRIAAAGLILIIAGFFIKPFLESSTSGIAATEQAGEVETPEEAYEAVANALALVSTKWDKGRKKAQEGMKRVEKATKVIK